MPYWKEISLPFASWGRPEFEAGFLSVWWAIIPSPCWFLCLTGFHCAFEALTPACQEEESPSGSSCLTSGGIYSWWSGEMHPVSKEPPRNVVGGCSLRYKTLRQIAGSKVLLCQHRLSRVMSKGWALRIKRSPLIHSCRQVTKAKRKSKI
jgi:hypothetical protein